VALPQGPRMKKQPHQKTTLSYLLKIFLIKVWPTDLKSLVRNLLFTKWPSFFTIFWPFNNYVDKMRWVGGQKMSVFVHAQGIKTAHAGVKKWQNFVHVVVECPLYEIKSNLLQFFFLTCVITNSN
jgi:hypothetical protein